MTGARLILRHVGPHMTLQDQGRPGLGRFGVPCSGAMDRLALKAANAALGNGGSAPAVEISPGGLIARHEGPAASYAVTGGAAQVARNGRGLAPWARFTLSDGDTLVVRPGPWGQWMILAVAGGFAAPRWLGSAATHAASGFGGGRLASGAVLALQSPRLLPDAALPRPAFARPAEVIRAIPGPQDRFFDEAALARLASADWRATSAFDRMGTRLAGAVLKPGAALDMPSEPVTRGALQVAGDGVPVLLMADHQTTGGYPRLATVIDPDLDAFSRLPPGRRFAFRLVTPAEAIAIARACARRDAQWLAHLAVRLAN